MTASEYLSQKVNFGGSWISLGDLYDHFPRRFVGLWLMGYETGGGEYKRD